MHQPRPGWTEQDPEDWWQATVKSVRQVLKVAKVKPDGVGGIGLSVVRWAAEAHGGTVRLLDSERGAAFEVVLPCDG